MSASKKIGLTKTIKKNTQYKKNDYDNEIFNSPIQFSKYNMYDILEEDYTEEFQVEYKEHIKMSILETFKRDFWNFQYKNNIGAISSYMSVQEWFTVSKYIFQYMYQLSQTNKIEEMIFEYGITKCFLLLINFYKNNISTMASQSDNEIIKYIYSHPISAIYADMSLAILRDAIGLGPYHNLIKM
uniref:Uncharacterized protein n=1 Tax=viral metagenome TaxID=1070528 RepID=A0A6C0J5Z2_9ZZZZ